MNSKKIIPFIIFSFLLFFSFTPIKAQNERETVIDPPHEIDKPDSLNLDIKPLSDSISFNPYLYMNINRYKDFLSPYQNFMIYSPFALDYNNRFTFFAQELSLTFYDTQNVYLGLGKIINRGFDIKWRPNSDFSMEAGLFYGLQYGYILNSKNRGYGFRLKANYHITDKLQLSIYGQYLLMQKDVDFFLNYMNVIPKTHIGSSIDYKPRKNTDIGVNMEYQYDNQKEVWKPEIKGKVKIGF